MVCAPVPLNSTVPLVNVTVAKPDGKLDEPPTFNVPGTDKVPVPETVNVLSLSVPFTVRLDRLALLTSEVTVWLAAMMTVSPSIGTAPLSQVEGELHIPVAIEVNLTPAALGSVMAEMA